VSEEERMIGFAVTMGLGALMFVFLWLFEWRHSGFGWTRWWAWHPIKLNGRTVWLRTVERRFCDMAGGGGSWWEYREAK
jgi:hypothetical protein